MLYASVCVGIYIGIGRGTAIREREVAQKRGEETVRGREDAIGLRGGREDALGRGSDAAGLDPGRSNGGGEAEANLVSGEGGPHERGTGQTPGRRGGRDPGTGTDHGLEIAIPSHMIGIN